MGIDKVNGVVEVYILNKIEEAKKTGELNLSFCNLVSLPESLFELTNLQTLNLQHNYFTILPKRLKELAGLTKLNFELNQLEDLPPEIGELTNLKKLNLKNNQLTTLPPEIGLLTNLTELDLSSNQLTTLPIEIALLTDLQNLYLQGNPLQIPPLEIADRGMAAIIDYFKNSTKAALLEKPEFDWNYDRNLHFEYQYKQTARVIMTCFIDRQRRPNRIENLLFWKDGVVLFYEDTKALVELDPGQLKIIVLIDGPKRKELLGIIRKDFHNIHSSLNVIEVKEMIPCVCNACAQEPQLFSFKTLKQSFANGQYKTLCAKSGAEVSIAEILGEIEDQTGQEPVDLFDGWRPDNLGETKFIIQKNEVVVLQGQHSGSRYNSEQLNQIIYAIIKKKIQSETKRLRMFENLQVIKNPNYEMAKRQIALELFKIFITYLSDNGEPELAGFLYEGLKNLPNLK